MKKLMVSTIIILPLIILAILLVSGAIMSLVTHIYVESVEFVDSGALVLVMDNESQPPAEQVEVTVLPLKAKNRDLLFSVEEGGEEIVSIDENGVVKARFYGEAYITVTSKENKAASATRKVIVTDSSVHALVMNSGFSSELYEDETQKMSVTVYPREAENPFILWSSSNESVLKVSPNGNVTAVGEGKATVTATSADNPEAQASAEIVCHSRITGLNAEELDPFVTSLRECSFPAVTPMPEGVMATVTYRSSDPSIATVDGEGHITFSREGHVTVTATATDFRGNTKEQSKEFTSTDGYYLWPIFGDRAYTLDFDEYFNDHKPLPIPFGEALAGSDREFIEDKYDVEGVLDFNEEESEFYFIGPMPDGLGEVRATVKVKYYNTDTNQLEEREDYFVLTVLRDAQKVAVSYGKTSDVATVVLGEGENVFTFGDASGAHAKVTVEPSNHTNTLRYEPVGELPAGVTFTDGNKLTFQKDQAGKVAVKVFLEDGEGNITASTTVTVFYAPPAKDEEGEPTQKGVEIVEGEEGQDPPEQPPIVLSMGASGEADEKEEGILYFNEPAATKVTYEVEKTAEDPAEEAVRIEERGGVQYIVPQKGGFATIHIVVTPAEAAAIDPALRRAQEAANAEGVRIYTFRVYVDRPVSVQDFGLLFDGSAPYYNHVDGLYTFGTSKTEVGYTFTVTERDGSMQGKKLYVKFAKTVQTGEDDANAFSDNIAFGEELGELEAIFGVEYTEEAVTLLGEAHKPLNISRTVTLKRNATGVTLTYKGVEVDSISTSQKVLTFTAEETQLPAQIGVKVTPENHKNKLSYSISEGEGVASVTKDGTLTFTGTGEVTVKISLLDDGGNEVCVATIPISYAPLETGNKVVEIVEGTSDYNLLLNITEEGNDEGIIDFTASADTAVEYKVAKGDGVVTLEEKENGWHIVPKKGGFATVTLTVTKAGEEKTYTIHVYVDRPVQADDLTVIFDTKECANLFGTTKTSVPYTVTFTGAEGAMEGKKLYVSYSGTKDATAKAGELSQSGEIKFGAAFRNLSVTFGVEYDAESTAVFGPENGVTSTTRTLERNADTINVTYKNVTTVNIMTDEKTLTIGQDIAVAVLPATHTDTVFYSVEGDCATLSEGTNRVITFQSAGTVTLKIEVKRGEALSVAKSVVISYEPAGANSKGVDIDVSGTKNVVLPLFRSQGDEATKEALLYFTVPESFQGEVSCAVTEGEGIVSVEKSASGIWHIVPKKGGFATVTVTAGDTRTVSVYVDRPVHAEDLTVTFSNDKVSSTDTAFTTSLLTVTYTLTVSDNEGSTVGKLLYMRGYGEEISGAKGETPLTGTIEFKQDSYTLTFGVKYDSRAADMGATNVLAFVSRTVKTTRGDLSELPTVTYGEGTSLKENSAFTLENIGSTLVFTVDTSSFTPADFELTYEKVRIDGNGNVGVEIAEGGTRVTLSAKNPVAEQPMSLTVGGQTFRFNVTVKAKADKLTFQYGDKPLENEGSYTTLLNGLSIEVAASRVDKIPVTDASVEYSLGGDVWHSVKDGKVSVDFKSQEDLILHLQFRSVDGGITGQLHLEKVHLENFSLDFIVDTDNQEVSVGKIDSENWPSSVAFCLPSNMKGSVTVKVHTSKPSKEELLGGFGTDADFPSIISAKVTAEGWSVSYNAIHDAAKKDEIVISTVSDGTAFNETVTIQCGEKNVTVGLSRIRLTSVEFEGFDNTISSDVYKGYQQVRVFAKHSDYAEGGVSKVVDYFKIPVMALNKVIGSGQEVTEQDKVDPSLLTWTLTRYNDKTGEREIVARQVGDTVTYGSATYTIDDTDGDGNYELQGAPAGVTWVDPFSEQGYARIYFGNFVGLSEVDVQNDYFGDFGEQGEKWQQAETHEDDYDKSGRKFAPSAGAFSYLRIEAGDGAVGGINTHFNFNVLQDPDADAANNLVNVFNATGYYKHSNLVLQENLYGEGELGAEGADFNKATEKGLFLDKVENLGKTLIYGNGNQVNFEQRNAELVKAGDKGTSNGVSVQKAYNATIKASTPTETVKKYEHVVVLKMQYAYYCDVEYYSKISPWGASGNTPGYIYLKNTVLRCAAQAALQLYYSTSTAYIENVVLNECVGGFVSDSQDGRYDVVYNFKGFVDVLNYMSFSGLASSINQKIGMMAELGFDAEIKNNEQYLEWFGKTPDAITSIRSGSEPWLTRRLFNVFLYNRFTSSQGSTLTIKYWDKDAQQYQTKEEGGAFDNGVGLATPIDQEAVMFGILKMGYYRVFVYDTSVALDGGQKTEGSQYYNDRNMKQLFSEDRYIRLLCQYKTLDGETPVKNFEHILWHTNQIYRDLSLAGQTERHIENLKNSLKDVQWPDGTTPADADPSLALARMLSETVLPGKDD